VRTVDNLGFRVHRPGSTSWATGWRCQWHGRGEVRYRYSEGGWV